MSMYDDDKDSIILGTHIEGRCKYDSRISFAIEYFDSPKDADRANAVIQKQRREHNGGYFHGMRCGRDDGFDYTDDDGVTWLAVTL